MEKNEIYVGTAQGYDEDGAGVVKIDGFVLFVKGLLDGEKAEIAITKMKKKHGYARVVKLLEESKERVVPKCSVYKQCGGCTLQHMSYEEQQRFKTDKVIRCFKNNAHLDVEPLPILNGGQEWNYRNKVLVPVQLNGYDVEMGFYQNHTNKIIPCDNCEVQTPLSNNIARFLKKTFVNLRCATTIRHVLIKHAHASNQAMVVLISRKYPFWGVEELVKKTVERFPEIKSMEVIVNQREDNVILDGKEILVHGNPYIEENLMDCTFRISAKSFYQINPYSTKELYRTAIDYCGLTGTETVLDMYCGTGTMGIIAAKNSRLVYGIDNVEEAINDAKTNAKINDVSNIRFFTMDAAKGADTLLRSKVSVDVAIVDPPRKGCTRETLDAIVRISPKRLVYVSCDPATLARDVAILRESGYELQKIQPVDMFPQTAHVETVVQLSKGNISSQNVRVEFSLEDMDMSRFQQGATYEQIQEWVQEKYGFHVTHLNIAKMKRKCGITERINYNLPKSENSKSPGTPKEKEEAIIDAFRHFQMF